jgi:hypothetical protein
MQKDSSLIRVAVPVFAIVVAINFVTMPAEEYPGYPGDADTVRVETITLLNTGKWSAPPEIAKDHGERGQYLYENSKGNRYPKYGVLNTLMYLPPLWLEKIATGSLEIHSASRVLFLNLLNVVLSGVTALYLVLLARRYTRSTIIISIFVLASLYSTFWWNYLRTQTFETYQTLFVLAFYYHFVSALDSDQSERKRNKQLLVAAIYFGALCLSKTVYVVLLPAIAALLVTNNLSITQNPHRALRVRLSLRERIEVRVQLLFFWLPVCIFLGLLAFTNWYKFDSPFASGYTQWTKEHQLFKSSNLFPALWGYLFSSHQSVFLHFPPLLYALAAWPAFFRKHRVDAIVAILFSFSLLLISSMFVNWTGQACHGPRYLLPILPLLSLPFIEYEHWLVGLPKLAKSVLITATAALLFYSTLLQVCLNSLPFFFGYDLAEILENKRDSKPALYLRSHQTAQSDLDFLLYRFGYATPFTAEFVLPLNLAESEKMSVLIESVQPNYYWFPELLPRVD